MEGVSCGAPLRQCHGSKTLGGCQQQTGLTKHAVHAVQWQESGQKAGHIQQQAASVQKSASLLQKAQQRFGPIPPVST
jgi:hypothetical protein